MIPANSYENRGKDSCEKSFSLCFTEKLSCCLLTAGPSDQLQRITLLCHSRFSIAPTMLIPAIFLKGMQVAARQAVIERAVA